MRRGVSSGMLVVIIVGIAFILLWTFSGVGIPGLQKLEKSIFGTIDVVKPGDKPVSPGGVLIKEPYLSVKLGVNPVSDIFSAAEKCFNTGLPIIRDKYSACAVVDPSSLSGSLNSMSLYEAKEKLNGEFYSGKITWITGELHYDWKLSEDFVSSSSLKFFICTEFSSIPVSSNAPYGMQRTITLVTLTRSSC